MNNEIKVIINDANDRKLELIGGFKENECRF